MLRENNPIGGAALTRRWTRPVVVLSMLVSIGLVQSGCGRENCDKLLQAACARMEDETDGRERCERLTKQAESVDDEQCAQNLNNLKESGRLLQQ